MVSSWTHLVSIRSAVLQVGADLGDDPVLDQQVAGHDAIGQHQATLADGEIAGHAGLV